MPEKMPKEEKMSEKMPDGAGKRCQKRRKERGNRNG